MYLLNVYPNNFFFCFTRKRLQDKTCPQSKNSVMTMIFQKVPPGHRSRNKEDDIFLAVDQTSNRVLHYQRAREQSKLQIPVVRKPTQAEEIQQLKPDIDNVPFFYDFMNMTDSQILKKVFILMLSVVGYSVLLVKYFLT